MNKFITLFCLILFSLSNSFSQQIIKKKVSSTPINILFVGNSLTYTNNLPELVKLNIEERGVQIKYKMIAFPNYAIEDHWNDGTVPKLIASEKYDFVIIQQGPSSQINGRNMLIETGEKLSILCESNNTQLCYFMVWPSINYYHTYDGVIKNYTDAASINNSILFPVGAVWKEYFDSTNDFQYYSSDGFHPSMEGSKIAAKTIVDYLLLELKN